MSEAKHTPGPWALDFGPDVDLVNHVGISAEEHGLLAQVVWKMDDDERSDTCEANARLIAASPDLLELLEQAVSIMKNCEVSSGICMCGDSMDGHQGQFESGHVPVDSGEYYKDCFLQKASAVVAKANGCTP